MSAVDPVTWSAVVGAASAVAAFGWGVRNSIRKDRSDREAKQQANVQSLIDAAIRADRERQRLADSEEENVELRRRLRDQ